MAGENVLERLTINLDIWESKLEDDSGDEWEMLGTVLTSSGWPGLKAIFLKTRLFNHDGSENDGLVE